MQNKIWEFRSEKLKKEDIIKLADSINLSPALTVVLMNRGIDTQDKVSSYFKKSLEGIHNPFMLNDMDFAVDRILSALSNREKITIYGDYDADGVTSTVLLYDFLKETGADIDYYLPDRMTEGYGINVIAVNKIARSGTKLMITVDCGINAVGEIEFAKTLGMDVIVTDHHTCGEELPRAVAVINPKRSDSTYPFSSLAGVGVAFKLVLAVAIRMRMNTKQIFMKYSDLTAVGTVADVVPLVDENRIIVDKGISAVKNGNNIGLSALLKIVGGEREKFDSTTAAFTIVPRINAAGRMGSAKLAAELLLEKSEEKALEIAESLNEMNKKRQTVEKEIFEEALAQAKAFAEPQYVYVLYSETWHEGVMGISASKICEMFYRPCILISGKGGKCKGSGRSVEEINLYDAISDSEEILVGFGGHSQAAGLTIAADKIDEFRKKINAYAKKILDGKTHQAKLYIDCRLNPSGVTMESAKLLKILEPFGEGNELPIFAMNGMKVLAAERIGSDGQHLRMKLTRDNGVFFAVGFGMGDCADKIFEGDTVNIAFTMGINSFRGNENLQLIIKDIKK